MGEPGLIEKASPSSINALKKCGLAVYRRRIHPRDQGPGPSNPVARLGTAAHQVLEWIANNAAECANNPQLEESIRRRWADETRTQEDAAGGQVLERANGPVTRWPKFAQIQEDLVVDGIALAEELAPLPPERVWAEREATSNQGDLGGSIDLVLVDDDNTATVIDHKAGAVTSGDMELGGRYSSQLLLYASLVQDLGPEPTAAEIRPLGRQPFPVEVSDQAIDAAVEAGREEVSTYNAIVRSGNLIQLAKPAEDACRWCEFLLDCEAIWGTGRPDLGEIETLQGTIQKIETAASKVTALRLESSDGPVTVTGLSPAQVPAMREFEVGDEVRIVGLTQREQGSYRPGGSRLDAGLLNTLHQGA